MSISNIELRNSTKVIITSVPPLMEGEYRFHVETQLKNFTGYAYYHTVESGKGMCYESNVGRPDPFMFPLASGFRSLYKKTPEKALEIFTEDLTKVLEGDIANQVP